VRSRRGRRARTHDPIGTPCPRTSGTPWREVRTSRSSAGQPSNAAPMNTPTLTTTNEMMASGVEKGIAVGPQWDMSLLPAPRGRADVAPFVRFGPGAPRDVVFRVMLVTPASPDP
jgi:hypothetical protein